MIFKLYTLLEAADVDTSPDTKQVREIVSKIHQESLTYTKNGKAGNQNCQLCTWAAEMQFRGEDVLPRPIYSPRDKALTVDGYRIVQSSKKLHIKSKDDIVSILEEAGPGSRFYTHVNWKNSEGGHEFIIMNINKRVYLVDAQAGVFTSIKSNRANKYFEINWSNSFLVRMDDKPVNRGILKYNDESYLLPWDDEKDMAYLKAHHML